MGDNIISILNESSLGRLVQWMSEYDCGTITAFRHEFPRKENLQRNVSLLAKLQSLRYKVTSVRGGYIEGYNTPDAIAVHENTFFVVNVLGKRDLESDLRHLGEDFNQDSIMYIPKGGQSSILWGTSKRPDNFPAYGTSVDFDNRKIGYKRATDASGKPLQGYNRPDPQFFTLKAGRPFFFESIYREYELPQGASGRLGVHAFATMDYHKIDEQYFGRVSENTNLDEEIVTLRLDKLLSNFH